MTIFEALPVAGGMLAVGIPDFRLPRKILENDIRFICQHNVEIQTGKALGRDFTIDSLLKQGYKAVFLAVGAHLNQKLNVHGEEARGVFPGVDFLRRVNLGEKIEVGEKVAVIGGGNVAIDAARMALRLGAKEVSIVYRRTRDEMPANDEEIEEAEHEKIKLLYLIAPTRIVTENGKVKGLECQRMELGDFDAGGRRRPVPVKGSEFVMEVDTVIPAIGYMPDLSCFLRTTDSRQPGPERFLRIPSPWPPIFPVSLPGAMRSRVRPRSLKPWTAVIGPPCRLTDT